MNALLGGGIASLAAAVTAGLVVVGIGAEAPVGDDAYAKREDTATEWVVPSDDDADDDDTFNGGKAGARPLNKANEAGANQGADASNQNTGAGGLAANRSGDASRDGNAPDRTRDGAGGQRDGAKNSAAKNSANDRSRHGTRDR